MPQDKRLIITRAVLHKVQRVCGSADAASAEGIFIEFVVPAVVVTQCPELTGKYVFQLPNRTYVMNGRTTCLIVPRLLSGGAFKVNKRHGYYDAVVTAEAICKRGDTEAARRAAQVAKTFAHFVVDSRIVSKLPSCITDGAVVTKVATMKVPSTVADEKSDRKNEQGRKGSQKPPDGAIVKGSQQYVETEKAPVGMPPLVKLSRKCITPLHNLDEQGNLTLRLAQGASGSVVRVRQAGQLVVRVGHGGMVPGEVCDNAKSFVYTLKREFPTVWKYIHEFQMTSAVTEPIRFMEVHIQK
ncbi:Ribosomal protein L1p/L10e family, putative [Trypanosoma equiperdum]|uniref:Ribosomal protein L1p/L10e family n=4 Tax=Trypanozoon TaxID=39700 RepID=Q38CE8_TRYB2|nr:hypothetical protein, conserved [Trypanosoma brucei gambiense DAL972]XP_822350.1 hypothetical protein, conserved [Trypanosoma brucei brucei TREU927]RHW69687.1 Ribosomal protein L1p/L10e family [Trypanosoma brucei equiperdum]SCU72495.1 Ribosomal protein L1p/L10e family, putative [Trypanosoma equiperdum]EAN77522.1 hypothetical protein, conserved [Trypanosoma brucei brucei TREU927]CBH15020.1 hypothetical protein, conserved [Trypanosoma brucei gambiense DAL972]|eukprot:XP_011777286.1 hypothetical protein, conserved [Trypanosoma brucei gambiense DAL972]